MSRVYLEALASGKALIASDIAGAREVVVHEDTGLLHRKGDVEDMAAQVVRAARDPALRDALGRRGRARVLERHDIGRAVDRYEAVLAELLGRRDAHGERARSVVDSDRAAITASATRAASSALPRPLK